MIIRESTLVILLLFSLFVISQGKKYTDPKKENREWQEFQKWKKSKSEQEKDLISRDNNSEKEISQILSEEDNNIVERKYEKQKRKEFKKIKEDKRISQNEKNKKDPPPINEAALMARYIVNQASKQTKRIIIFLLNKKFIKLRQMNLIFLSLFSFYLEN